MSLRVKKVSGKSLNVTRINSSFDEIDCGADNGAVLAYGTAVVKSEDTISEAEEQTKVTSRCSCK